MDLPVRNTAGEAQRTPSQVRAMAVAVQANLVQLKVADAKRRGIPSNRHEIAVPAPGFVRDFRETLIDHTIIAAYPEEHLRLRIREIWGQFCVLHWLFSQKDPPARSDLSKLPADPPMRCGPVVDAKHDEIHAVLWLLRFEQRRRHDPDYPDHPEFAELSSLADKITADVYNKRVGKCSDAELVYAACEYAGMLAAIRWSTARIRTWGEEAAMQVAARPF